MEKLTILKTGDGILIKDSLGDIIPTNLELVLDSVNSVGKDLIEETNNFSLKSFNSSDVISELMFNSKLVSDESQPNNLKRLLEDYPRLLNVDPYIWGMEGNFDGLKRFVTKLNNPQMAKDIMIRISLRLVDEEVNTRLLMDLIKTDYIKFVYGKKHMLTIILEKGN